MKTIGLIGGMSWESTTLYYRTLNREISARLGGLHSAKLLLESVDFEEIAAQQRAGKWDELAAQLCAIAKRLESAGANAIVICTNTMHKVAPQVSRAISVPLLHIATPAIEAIHALRLTRVGLLGTRFTMEQPFLRDAYAAAGIECMVPDESQRNAVHRLIFDELCKGVISDAGRAALLDVAQRLNDQGAQAIVLGCTELTLSLKPEHCPLPLVDTTELHAKAAAKFALS